MSDWRDDLKDSSKDFRETVVPILKDWTDARNVSVEANTESDLAAELDETAGVDSWSIKHDNIVRGVGSRVQYLSQIKFDKPPNTFTVRKERQSGVKTEYEKRLYAIQNGGLYPYWTTQAYLSEPRGELLSVGRVRTKDLIYHIKDGDEGEDYYVVSPPGEASFYVVNWWRLEEVGVGVRTAKPYKEDATIQHKADTAQKGLMDYVTDGGRP